MSKRIILFAVLALVYSCVSFHRVTMAVMGDLLAEDFALGPSDLGLLGGILLYCYAFAQIPSGVFADNVGPKRTILLSLILSTAGSALFALSPGYTTAMIGRVLIGIGIGCIYLSVIKILSAWFKQDQFGTVLGILLALGQLGNMLATAPLAFSVKAMGWRSSYLLVAVLTVGLIALVVSLVKNAPEGETASDKTENDPEQKSEKTAFGGLADTGRAVVMLLRDRTYLLLAIFMIAGSSQQGFQGLWAGPFLTRAYDYSIVEVGSSLMWFAVGGMFGSPMWGFLSDRIFKSRRRVLILSSLIVTTLWFFPSFVPTLIPRAWIPILFFFMGIGWGAVIQAHAMIRDTFSLEILGIAVGIINFLTFLGGAAFTHVMGMMVELFPKTNGDYPLIAYQSTLMLIFAMWLLRLITLSFTKEAAPEEG